MPPFLPFLITGLSLAAIGWGGLYVLITRTLPTLGPRWLFYFLLTLAVSGLVLPVYHFLHRRFPGEPPADAGVIVREAALTAIYVDLIAWLQLGKVLTPPMAVIIAGGMLLVELLMRIRERSRFKPRDEHPDA